jgi:hypothetical protein
VGLFAGNFALARRRVAFEAAFLAGFRTIFFCATWNLTAEREIVSRRSASYARLNAEGNDASELPKHTCLLMVVTAWTGANLE